MSKAEEKIDKDACESGNKEVFIQGIVYGLGLAYPQSDTQDGKATIDVILDRLDKKYFQGKAH